MIWWHNKFLSLWYWMLNSQFSYTGREKTMFSGFPVSKNCQVFASFLRMHTENECCGGEKINWSSEQCTLLHFSDSVLSGFTREVQSPCILPQLNFLVRTFVKTKMEDLTRRRPAYREHSGERLEGRTAIMMRLKILKTKLPKVWTPQQ